MPVADPYIDAEALQATANDKKPMYEAKIRAKIAQLVSVVSARKQDVKNAENSLDKFKADVSNCMTEADTAQFIANNGL